MSVSSTTPLLGHCLLTPKRHIAHITDLDGQEAQTFGPVIARCAASLKQATEVPVVYIHVYGDQVWHLHVHLAPHHAGDALSEEFVKGESDIHEQPSGAKLRINKDYPPVGAERLRALADRTRALLDE